MTGHEARTGACGETLALWCVLAPAAMAELGRDGRCLLKRRHIEEKHGECAWSFLEAYGWLARRLEDSVARPCGAELPYRLFADSHRVTPAPGSTALLLEVPASEALTFDLRAWERVEGLRYIGADGADERGFEGRLASQGVKTVASAFRTPFFPLVRREIVRSWDRLPASAEGCPPEYLAAAVWQVRREWVVREEPCR